MGQVTVNGITVEVPPGKSVSVINGQIAVDGLPYAQVDSDKIVICPNKNSPFNLTCEGNVEIQGAVSGDVNVTGDLNCGNIMGSVKTDEDLNCEKIMGNVTAREVNCSGKIIGNVSK